MDIKYKNERYRTINGYNMQLLDYVDFDSGVWNMPIIWNDNYIPKKLIGFSATKVKGDENVGVHFYLDDYRFERIWNTPERYINMLKNYDCVLSPDFSLYIDMPMAIKIWNIYRSRLIGAYLQSAGIKVIPTISWAEPTTYDFCFEGIPKGSIVSISTIGVKKNESAKAIWEDGVQEMIKRIEPSAILIYGGKIDFDYGDITTVYYDNEITKRLEERR